MKATKQYFPVVQDGSYFCSVDEFLKCYHSNQSYWAVLSCGTVYCAVQGDSNFRVCERNPKVWQFKWKLLSNTFLWCCLLCCTRRLQLLTSRQMKLHSATIQIDWYFPTDMVLPYHVCCALGRFKLLSQGRIKLPVTIQMKATENYFAVALLVMSTEIILAFISVDDRGSVMDILYWGQIKTENIWYVKGWNAKGERRTKHNQFRMFLPDTRETWENWASRFFQVTIYFLHPDHT